MIILLSVFIYKNFQRSIPTPVYDPHNCLTGKMEGKTVSDLYACYLGVANQTKLEKSLDIDFSKNLTVMWEKKKKRSPSPVVDEATDKLIVAYTNPTKMTFEQYSDHINTVVTNLKNEIDWDCIKRKFKFSKKELALVKNISMSFTGRDMSAYMMTELMPSSNGVFNADMMDLLLKYGGREYVESLPAMFDEKTSFGPYQFTEYAVFSTPKETRGASIINCAVQDSAQKIPGSVIKLVGDDHHRAAYMFAVYNICVLVKGLSLKERKTLDANWRSNQDDLFLYCATAHHLPAVARTSARRWIDNKCKFSFEQSCSSRIVNYAKKTRNNLRAI